jgi:hypothetical protein
MKISLHHYPIPGQRYQHYKGGHYRVLHLSKHTETDEIMVIYQSLHFGSYHARPIEKWLEKVDSPTGYRFYPVNDPHEN